ncbi:MAG: methyltransferase domain-containing protein [Akkermansiaceae bacterium]|nr:methyltransferase domain-containing protein [Akkermansiaceae bacterium]
MSIDYDYKINGHAESSGSEILNAIFKNSLPSSLLDFGCGPGTWLKAAKEMGVSDLLGIDGTDAIKFANPNLIQFFYHADITKPVNLKRKFDVALCLEVAEHVDEYFASHLIEILTAHADVIYFSAACPDQPGQHHVNCQWPSYWQNLFNQKGFDCYDELRWQIWDNTQIEPWYRQNIFMARKADKIAGKEKRIKAAIHPELYKIMSWESNVAIISECDRLSQDHYKLNQDHSKLNQDHSKLNQDHSKLNQDHSKLNQDYCKLNQDIKYTNNLLYCISTQLDKSNAKIQDLKSKLIKLKGKNVDLSNRIDKIKKSWWWRFSRIFSKS